MTDWLINRWHVVIGSSVLNQAFTKANIASTWQVYQFAIFPLYNSFLVSFDEVSWIPYHIRYVSTTRSERDRRPQNSWYCEKNDSPRASWYISLTFAARLWRETSNLKLHGRRQDTRTNLSACFWTNLIQLVRIKIGLHLIDLTRPKRE